jgi:hypothetical protein
VTPTVRRPAWSLRVPTAAVVLAAGLLVAALAGCATGPASIEPSAPAGAAPTSAVTTPSGSPELTPVPGGSVDEGPTPVPSGAVGRTETDWGVIWDELPPSFPLYPGSIPTITREGAASGEFSVPAAPDEVATWMQSALETATYSTESLDGPLEDGSMILNSVGDAPDCKVEVTIKPLSGTTYMGVRLAAACPFQ